MQKYKKHKKRYILYLESIFQNNILLMIEQQKAKQNWGSSPQAWRPPPSRKLQQMKKLIDQADSWLQLLKVSYVGERKLRTPAAHRIYAGS